MSNTPILSVILCTYNNADSLAVTLEQLSKCQVADSADVEILIIDNNSKDHTAAVVEKAMGVSKVPVEYCFEERQGLSNARNHGLKKARAAYLLFTDDDADIPTDWIENYLKEIRSTQADCLFSSIEIKWDKPKPWWFDGRYGSFFVQLDFGDVPFQVTDIHHEFFGKNFCCKKTVLEALGGFDERLGRQGTALAAGEETVIYRRLIEGGANVVYFPDAPVGHRLKPEEYSAQNIEKKFVDGAVSSLTIADYFATKRLFGRPVYPLKNALVTVMRSCFVLPLVAVSNAEGARRDVFFNRLELKRALRMIRLWIKMP